MSRIAAAWRPGSQGMIFMGGPWEESWRCPSAGFNSPSVLQPSLAQGQVLKQVVRPIPDFGPDEVVMGVEIDRNDRHVAQQDALRLLIDGEAPTPVRLGDPLLDQSIKLWTRPTGVVVSRIGLECPQILV